MKFTTIAIATTAFALTASPAMALPSQATDHKPATPGAHASLPAKAKAYGKYCNDQSKQHVEGQKGTPFSVCVTGMAKLANDNTNNPRTACKDESKKHVDGEKGTPFSRCVKGGAQLLRDQDDAEV